MINITREEFSNLQPLVDENGRMAEGTEAKLFVFDKSTPKGNQLCALKIYHNWDNKTSINYLNHREKRNKYFYKINESKVVMFPRESFGIEDIPVGFLMRCLPRHHSVRWEINGPQAMSFYDLRLIVKNIIRLNNALHYDLHDRGIYMLDFTSLNVVISDNKSYIVDADGCGIDALSNYGESRIEYKGDDIRCLVAMLIRLIAKRSDSFDIDSIFQGLKLNSFERTFIKYLKYTIDYQNVRKVCYIDNDALGELADNYYMEPNGHAQTFESRFLLKRKF